jgi:pyroglutamyl-peptidase
MAAIVLTAFEPFGGRSRNRSAEVLARVGDVPGVTVEKVVLPVELGRLPAVVELALARRPDALVLLGEAGRATDVAVERLALNVIDARIPDNRGEQPRGTPVVPGGALALPSTWRHDDVVGALRAAGLPVRTSHHAGTFACNAALYLALAASACPAGFIHVPAWRWPLGPRLDRLARGVENVLAALGREVQRDDERRSPGHPERRAR